MTALDLQAYRQRLSNLTARVSAGVARLEGVALAPAGSLATGNADDPGTREAEGEAARAVLGSEEEILAEARAALGRIDQGTFGRCEECGHPIGKARLDALPYARCCVRCAREATGG